MSTPLTMLTASPPRTLAEQAYAAIREAIVTARLAPGERLLPDEIAKSLEMSSMPVREALRRLAATSLVEVIPHRGATVARLSMAELKEVFALRHVIEDDAIRRGAAGFGEADRAAATTALSRYDAALDTGDFGLATAEHQVFHLALYRSYEFPWLVRTVIPLWETSSRYWHWLTVHAGWRHDEGRKAHEVLLERCGERDGDGAAEALDRHLARSCNLLVSALELAGTATSVAE